jgi:hypothetical protein
LSILDALREVFQDVCKAALALTRLMGVCRRPSNCHGGRWQARRPELCQPSEILSCCSKKEFIACTAWASQPQSRHF